jgi:D-xylose transport system substrate-binding protein
MKIATKRAALVATALLLTAGTLTACSSTASSSPTSGATNANPAVKIGLLLPDNVTARYAAADKPYFTAAITKLDPNATVLYQDANGSASTQQQQAESMLAQGLAGRGVARE